MTKSSSFVQQQCPPGCKKYLSSAVCDQQKQFLFEAGEVGETRPRATASLDQRLKFFLCVNGSLSQLAQKRVGKKKSHLRLTSKPVLKRHRVPRHFFHNPHIPVICIAPFLSPRSDRGREVVPRRPPSEKKSTVSRSHLKNLRHQTQSCHLHRW